MGNEDEDRTTAFGLFNFAHSYWKSASALTKAKVRATHAHDPIWYLYTHAVELFLKAYLRAKGATEDDLRKKYGHKVSTLAADAEKDGLHFDDEDREVVGLMDQLGTTLRYIRRGPWTRPSLEALERTCRSFHQSVAEELLKQGHKIRYYRPK